MISVHKSVAHPWQCDVLGHLTTRFYVAMFDDSSYHFLYEVFGWQGASDDDGKLGGVDARPSSTTRPRSRPETCSKSAQRSQKSAASL